MHTCVLVAKVIAQNSTTAFNQMMMFCFLLLQEIRFPPTNARYVVVEHIVHLSIGKPAQSALRYP